MSQSPAQSRFFNYPRALQGPDTQFVNEKKQNPRLTGLVLLVSAFLIERIRVIREHAWLNAGFGSLRNILSHIENYEPWYEPKVTPLPLSQDDAKSGGQKAQLAKLIEANAGPESKRASSVAEYRALYLSGEFTPTDVVRAILPLIRRDTAPPGKHSVAWFELKLDLILKAAEESTLRYKNNKSLGPLDGVPTALKDEYDLDGYSTTLGSISDYKGEAVDGESITSWLPLKLEEAGAIILGKLSMHEFGLDTTGQNSHYGTPPNPFNPRYYTGGSSSGPGYAISSGLIPIALGSDGGGSIRIPSACCSIFGLKPTHARLSTWPGANHSPTCAVQGPMAVDMQSLAIMYDAIAEPHPSTQFPPLARQLAPPLTRVLGIYEAWFSDAEPGVQSVVRNLIDKLVSQHGYDIVSIKIPFVVEGQRAHALTVLTDAATLLDDTTGISAGNRVLHSLGRATKATDYLLAQKLRSLLMQHLAHLWKLHPGMLIVTPTLACAGWPIRGGQSELRHGVSDGNQTLESMEYVWLANFCGLPSISVPAGYVIPEGSKGAGSPADKDTEGMIPIGLMATGEWCSENALLQFGFDAEQAGQDDVRCRPPIWEDVVSRAKTQAKTDTAVGDNNVEV